MRDKILRGAVRGVLGSRALVSALGRGRRHAHPELDPQIAAVLAMQQLARIPALDSMQPPAARTFAAEGLSPLDPDSVPMARILDVIAPGPAGNAIPVRCYVPDDALPHWIVYFHGGGGVIGSIATSEPACRLLAQRSRCTVASVDYRLGPEDRNPAAIEDAVAAFDAIAPRAPATGKVAVAGDSFGGFLAAHVDHATRVRGTGRHPDAQGLLYPIVDLTLSSPSIARHADGFLLTRSLIYWFRGNYLRAPDDVAEQRAYSPQFWPDAELRGAAPAVVATAGFDPLVDEGDAWARRLAGLGVTVRHRENPSLIHGFLSLSGAIRGARSAVDVVADDLRELLNGRS